jgi:hypothetical protein
MVWDSDRSVAWGVVLQGKTLLVWVVDKVAQPSALAMP